MNHQQSERLFTAAKNVIPGGVNSPARAFRNLGIEPIVAASAKGAEVVDEADDAARRTEIGDDVMAIHGNRTVGCIDDAADNRDQGGFSGAVGAEQRQDFTTPDIQAQVLQCLVAAGVGLGYI